MHHLTREKAAIHRLLSRVRTIAIVGASPRGQRHSNQVFGYLRSAGYDVVPVRVDRADVDGVSAYESLDAIPGRVDLAIIYRRPEEAASHFAAAARKGVEAVWLPPGAAPAGAEDAARDAGVPWLIRDLCPLEEHRHFSAAGGSPTRFGSHAGRRKTAERAAQGEEGGYASSGGGGHAGGGGVRAVLDEKKMTSGHAARRHGKRHP